MSEDNTDTPTPETALHTAQLTALTREGKKIGLEHYDMLIAVNGVPFAHDKAELTYRLSHLVRGRTALTFRRDDEDFTIIATSPALGAWDPVEAPDDVQKNRISPGVLINWEIYTNDADQYDLQPLNPSLVALIIAPVWLAQMHLWVPLATIISVVIITLPFGLWMAIAVYGVGSVYVWRMSQDLFRSDRLARGFATFRVVAAPSEKYIHDYCKRINPDLVYVHMSQHQTQG